MSSTFHCDDMFCSPLPQVKAPFLDFFCERTHMAFPDPVFPEEGA